jgi:hypothetical protein
LTKITKWGPAAGSFCKKLNQFGPKIGTFIPVYDYMLLIIGRAQIGAVWQILIGLRGSK